MRPGSKSIWFFHPRGVGEFEISLWTNFWVCSPRASGPATPKVTSSSSIWLSSNVATPTELYKKPAHGRSLFWLLAIFIFSGV